MTVLIDSSAWIDFFFGNKRGEKVKAMVSSDEAMLISSLNLLEVYAKFFRFSEREAEEKKAFLCSRAQVVPADREIVLEAAKLKVRRGLSTSDSIVWVTAEKRCARLVTSDTDFKGYKPLELLR